MDNPLIPTVKYATLITEGDGVKTAWEFNFAGGYISPEHVKAFTENVATGELVIRSLTLIGPNTAQIVPAVADGLRLVIYRDTPKTEPLVNYSTGSIMNESSLDKSNQQAVFIAAELADRVIADYDFSDALLYAVTTATNANNVANAVDGKATTALNNSVVAVATVAALGAANGAALVNGATQVVPTVAALRGLLKTSPSKFARTLNYSTTVSGGSSNYYLDLSDTTTPDNQCTVIVAADGGRWKLVHQGTIHIEQWGNNLPQAVDFMPAPGHLLLGAGPYVANFTKTRSDLKITGVGMPMYNGSGTAMFGGTIIQGTVRLTGDRLSFGQFGIDCGSVVCTAINGGVPMDGLVVLDATRATRYQIVARDVRVLASSPTAAVHNFLFEGVTQCRFENLISRNGQWGTVMKTTDSTADGIISYNCSQAGFTFKSDTGVAGSPALRSTVSNVLIDNTGLPTAAAGILIYAATSSIAGLTLSNWQVYGGDVGVFILCDTRAVNVNIARDITLNNGIIESCVSLGFKTFGAISGVLVNNLDIRGTLSNKSMQVGSDCLGIELNNVLCSAPAANALNVDLGGRFSLNGLRSCVNGDYNSPSGINLVPESVTTFKLGAYLGTLGFAGVTVWTPTIPGLTVGGAGGTVITGSFAIIGKVLKFRVQIAVTGSATTASVAGTTILNNLPFRPLFNDTCHAISGTVTQGGTGFIQGGTQNVYLPAWSAYAGTFVVSGQYIFQP